MKGQLKKINIRDIIESPVNARQMKDKEFYRLVRNLERDKQLTSSVLLMKTDGKKLMCISGHHRIKACRKAKIATVPAIVIEKISDDDRVRLQISHNDINGFDDDAILSAMIRELSEEMYEFIDINGVDVDLLPVEMEKELDVPEYRYVNLCFLPDTEKEFSELLDEISLLFGSKVLVSESEYTITKEMLTKAHRLGFKSAGQAFRKFIDIVKDSDEIKKTPGKNKAEKKRAGEVK